MNRPIEEIAAQYVILKNGPEPEDFVARGQRRHSIWALYEMMNRRHGATMVEEYVRRAEASYALLIPPETDPDDDDDDIGDDFWGPMVKI